MKNQKLNILTFSLLTLSSGQIAAHDPGVEENKGPAVSVDCIIEVPGTGNRASELPADVLVFLYEQLGLTTKVREDEPAKAKQKRSCQKNLRLGHFESCCI